MIQLDDRWPESVEEQGLLLLVWRRNFRNDLWKMCHRQSRRGVSRQDIKKCKTIVCIADTLLHTYTFTHKSFYTQKLLHTVAFTQTLYTQTLLQTKAFTHRSLYTQTLLHTDTFTQTRLHADTFTHRRFYTQRLLHAQKLLHTDAFTHRGFYTHRHFLHTDAFTHRRFYTKRLLHTHTHTHTDAFTHRHFHTRREQGLLALLALQAKGYHRFNWEEVTIDVPWLTVRPWYTITSIESHKTWGGAWTRIPYIGRASVDRVGWWSPISMWTGKERKWSHPKPACINMSWGLCALGPLQPRWFAISPKRSINGRTWQAANVSGLMHDGETEGLKQRCVHQQVSDSSGWLMLMHFIFKFNCPSRLPRSILIWAPPRSWPYLQRGTV